MPKMFFTMLIGSELLGILALQQANAQSPAPDYNPIIGQVVLLITTLAGFGYQMWQQKRKELAEERKRQWDLEDRERARREIAEKAMFAADRATEVIHHATERVLQKVEENTQLSRDAFNEANNYNSKLGHIMRRFASDEDPAETLHTIDRTTKETKAKVDEIGDVLHADAAAPENP